MWVESWEVGEGRRWEEVGGGNWGSVWGAGAEISSEGTSQGEVGGLVLPLEGKGEGAAEPLLVEYWEVEGAPLSLLELELEEGVVVVVEDPF